MATAPHTVIAEQSDARIVLRESDATARAVTNAVLISFGVFILLYAMYRLLGAVLIQPPTPSSAKGGVFGVFFALFGVGMMAFGSTKLVRERYTIMRESVAVTYRSKFKTLTKTYRTNGATATFTELSSTMARGGIIYDTGLALTFCNGDIESVGAIVKDAATLLRLPPPQYLLVDAPSRELAFIGDTSELMMVDRDEVMRVAERLSWKAQGVEKKYAHLGRFDDAPKPEARHDGAFALTAYPHSFWDTATKTVRFVVPNSGETIVPFEQVANINIASAKPKMIHVQTGHDYVLLVSTVTVRLPSGETHPLVSTVRIEFGTVDVPPAESDARALAAYIARWIQAPEPAKVAA